MKCHLAGKYLHTWDILIAKPSIGGLPVICDVEDTIKKSFFKRIKKKKTHTHNVECVVCKQKEKSTKKKKPFHLFVVVVLWILDCLQIVQKHQTDIDPIRTEVSQTFDHPILFSHTRVKLTKIFFTKRGKKEKKPLLLGSFDE